MSEKPDCYKCMHRGPVPGSCHSSCRHPRTKKLMENCNLSLAVALRKRTKMPPIIGIVKGITVKGDPGGIANGWFNWPWDFDPVWLLECDGFKEK